MTPPPDIPENDSRLSAAWREHSTEMPPAQLDVAILAAAHRAVGSAPRSTGKKAAEAGVEARAATGPQRWWMPLAAAATIGAIALGILQTAPQETRVTASSVSDTPARPSQSATPLPAAPTDKLATLDKQEMPQTAVGSLTAAAPAKRSASFPEKPSARVVSPQVRDNAVPPPAQVASAPEPFPAQKKSESAESADAKDRAPAAAMPAAPPIVAQQSELARTYARQRNEVVGAPGNAPAIAAMAKTTARADAAAAPAVDIDAWIIRIRKLHDDGRLAEAAKELIALRAAIPDADGRLPPELRAWAGTVKP